jgi:hypothetical protein
MPGVNVSKQSFNTLIILIGTGLLVYDFVSEPSEVYYKVAGLVVLMFGLYKSTQQWTKDNNTQDDPGIDEHVLDDDFDEDKLNDNEK